MIRAIVVVALMSVCGVGHAAEMRYKKFIATNAQNVSKLAVGMTKEQVMSLMGDHTSKVPNGKLSNPYRVEAFQRESSTYEVLYYLTRIHPPFTGILDNQATPIIFRDGVVTGWGRSALQGIVPK